MKEKQNRSIFENIIFETKDITKKILLETGKTYQGLKTNLDISNLKKRRRERLADLGFKVFTFIADGKLKVPGVEYLISELKALNFQIKLKEEDLIEFSSETANTQKSHSETKSEYVSEKKDASSPKVAAQPTVEKDSKEDMQDNTIEEEIKTVKLNENIGENEDTDKSSDNVEKKKETKDINSEKQSTIDPIIELSSLNGIGEKLALKFVKAGYDSIEKLAAANKEDIGKLLNRSTKTAEKYISTAKEAL